MSVQPRDGYVVEVSGSVRQPKGVFQPVALLENAGCHGVEDDASVGQPFGAHMDRHGQRVAVVPLDGEFAEGDVAGSEETVQDVVAPRSDSQPEIGQCGFQLLYVDALGADLLRQHPGAPAQGRDQRVEGVGGGKRQCKVAGGCFGPGRDGVGTERDARRTDVVRAVFVPDFEAVEGDAGGVIAFSGGGCVGFQRERSADGFGGEAQCGQVEAEDVARKVDVLLLRGQRSGNEQ